MRDAIKRLGAASVPQHPGLAYDVWAPADDSGKIPNRVKDSWFDQLEKIEIAPDYHHAYLRWVGSLGTDGSRAARARFASRLLVGSGTPSATEVGLTLHHTWGVPFIPGSALKGLLNHYVDAVYGPDPGSGAENDERKKYRGVEWRGARIVKSSGEIHGALFGRPDTSWTEEEQRERSAASRGFVVFHDALLVSSSVRRKGTFARDVLTPHQGAYYGASGTARPWPNDYEDPVPVSFLTVRPGAEFLVALSGPKAWTALALELLQKALEEWGVGAKTVAGYGRAAPDRWKVEIDPDAREREEEAAADPTWSEFSAWLENPPALADTGEPPNKAQRARIIEEDWIPRLRDCDPSVKEKAHKAIKKNITGGKKWVEIRRGLLSKLADASEE